MLRQAGALGVEMLNLVTPMAVSCSLEEPRSGRRRLERSQRRTSFSSDDSDVGELILQGVLLPWMQAPLYGKA